MNINTLKFLLITISIFCWLCYQQWWPRPYENVNRKIYNFNKKVDKYSTKPIAKTYSKLTPKFVQTGIKNFISNLDNLPTAANNLLQGNFKKVLKI